MFMTGLFRITEDGYIFTAQRVHSDCDDINDDVISTILEEDKESYNDGYVSNDGKVITIHIKKEMSDENTINSIKRVFSLNKEDLTVLVELFNGW